MEKDSRTLELPEGYTIEPMHEESSAGHQLLVLRRSDRSPVVAFELCALGPSPARIYEIALEDAEKSEQTEEQEHIADD